MPHSRGEAINLRADLQNRLEDFALSQLMGANNSRRSRPFDGEIPIRGFNTSASLMERDSLARISKLVLDPDVLPQARREPTVELLLPATASDEDLAVVLQPIAPGASGEIAIGGVCHATVLIVSTSHGYAEPDPDTPGQLRSAADGIIKIVAIASGAANNDTRVCLIRFGGGGGSRMVRFTLTAPFTGSSAPADFTEMDGTVIGSGSLEDPEAEASDVLTTGWKGRATAQDGKYYFAGAKCDQVVA